MVASRISGAVDVQNGKDIVINDTLPIFTVTFSQAWGVNDTPGTL